MCQQKVNSNSLPQAESCNCTTKGSSTTGCNRSCRKAAGPSWELKRRSKQRLSRSCWISRTGGPRTKNEMSSRLSMIDMSASVARAAKHTEHKAEVRTAKAAVLFMETAARCRLLEASEQQTASRQELETEAELAALLRVERGSFAQKKKTRVAASSQLVRQEFKSEAGKHLDSGTQKLRPRWQWNVKLRSTPRVFHSNLT